MRGHRLLLIVGWAAGCTFPSLRFGAEGDAAADVAAEVAAEAAVDAAPDAPALARGEFLASPSCPTEATAGCRRVRVPGGTFALGEAAAGSAPVQPGITVDGFVVDATEVTVQRFRRFYDALLAGAAGERFTARYPTSPPTELTVERASLPTPLVDAGLQCNWTPMARSPARESHPINCLPWEVALAFCVWDGGRLPTEAEYEHVARHAFGPAGSPWPWGEEAPSCARAHWLAAAPSPRCPGDDTQPTRRVASLSLGARGPVFDLAGNVSEWAADEFLPYAPPASPNRCWGLGPQRNPLCRGAATLERVVRGGGWSDDDATGASLRGAARVGRSLHNGANARGARCVRALLP